MSRKTTDEYIDNSIFRDKYLRLERYDGLTCGELAYRLDWQTTDRDGRLKPDGSRVSRMLGLVSDGKGGANKRQSVSYDNAVLLCRALHVEYVDAGV